MSARTIAIGDIHGCSEALRVVLSAIEPQETDTIVPLGDYIDRGPDSRGAIEQLLTLEKQCRVVPLLGNHELMLIDALQNPYAVGPWRDCGGDATLASYGGSLLKIPGSHLEFIRRCRRYYETATHFFIHANYQYDLPLDEQPDYLAYWEHIYVHLPLWANRSRISPQPHENGKIAVVGHTSQKNSEIL
ncbi:MAG TPA: metallophosphoesterase, partial [Pirellulaceae bacterium]|nr:metallophosphoesterase [Pirellulaceae bacterium]